MAQRGVAQLSLRLAGSVTIVTVHVEDMATPAFLGSAVLAGLADAEHDAPRIFLRAASSVIDHFRTLTGRVDVTDVVVRTSVTSADRPQLFDGTRWDWVYQIAYVQRPGTRKMERQVHVVSTAGDDAARWLTQAVSPEELRSLVAMDVERVNNVMARHHTQGEIANYRKHKGVAVRLPEPPELAHFMGGCLPGDVEGYLCREGERSLVAVG